MTSGLGGRGALPRSSLRAKEVTDPKQITNKHLEGFIMPF